MRKLLKAALCAATFALNIGATGLDLSSQSPTPITANQEYIARFKDLAMFDQLSTGIPASIKLGQALLESQAGESELAMNANNHFGLKCRNCSENEAYMKTDDEYDKKTGALIYSKFQRFNTPEASYSAHSHRLTTESRYRTLFNNDRTNYRAWAYGLQKCGYATAKDYGERLIRVIEENNLQRFDKPSFLTIPEIAGTSPPQYPGDNLSVNVPYNSDPNATNQAYLVEKPRKDAVGSIKTSQSNSKKIINNFCTESTYISKDGEQMQFTLYEVTLEETHKEEVNAKNAAPKKQKAVLSQPVQRLKTVREPK